MLVPLMKKTSTYKDKDGNEKQGLSLYVQCGDEVIGVQPVYYGKEGSPDKGYVARKAILSSYASPLPPKEASAQT